MISQRVKNIRNSPTVEMAAKAIALKEAGEEIFDLSVGEPDFPTPEHIKEAAHQAMVSDLTRYTTNNGLNELREAVAAKLLRENRLNYRPDQILISAGAKHALFNVLMSVIRNGDEVIIPAPYWGSYPEIVRLAGGRPVFVATEQKNGFHITPEQLQNALSPKTRAIVFCNPVNPTGAAYDKEQLNALAQILDKQGTLIIADEIYEKLLYDDQKFTSFAALGKNINQNTILINGLSKAYAMTGWRVGYAAGPVEVISAAAKIQSHSTSAASTISQYAAIAALNGPQVEISKMVMEFQKRRDYFVSHLQDIPGIASNKPQGAFYIFPNISSFFGMMYEGVVINNSIDFANYLLDEAKVVVVPGSGFGADQFIRISYSTSMDKIEQSLIKIKTTLAKLKSAQD